MDRDTRMEASLKHMEANICISPDEEPSIDTARTTSPACNLSTNFNTIYTFPHWLVLKFTFTVEMLSTPE